MRRGSSECRSKWVARSRGEGWVDIWAWLALGGAGEGEGKYWGGVRAARPRQGVEKISREARQPCGRPEENKGTSRVAGARERRRPRGFQRHPALPGPFSSAS